MGNQRRGDLLDGLGAQVDHERRAVRGEVGEPLSRRHGRCALAVAREDHRLRDLGDRELAAQAGGGGGEGGDARGDVPRDAERVEAAHLLGRGAVDREVPGVQPRDVLPARMGGLALGDDLVEREVLRIDDPGVGGRVGEDLRRDERARVEADGTARDRRRGRAA